MPNKILNIGSNSSLVDVNIPGILTASTPTSSSSNNQVATKEYVDTEIANIDALPAQSGNNGKFLTTNGTTASWANVDALPSQTGNSGKFLTTNGTAASWSTLDLSNYVPISTEESYDDGYITNTISNGIVEYGDKPCVTLSSWYTEPGSAGEYDSEAYLEIDPYGITIAGNISFAWGGFDASSLSSGTVNWNRLPTSRIYDATASRTANTVLAAPNGSAGAATFRKLVEADLPTISASKISGTVSSATSATTVARATFGDSSNGTHDANAMTSNGLYYYTANGPTTSIGASTTDGAIYCQAYSTSWVGQIAQDYRDGDLFIRGKNNGTWQSWKRIWATGDAVTSAVWNDYAEYREVKTQELGRCVIENGDDTMSLSTKRLQKGCSITSDTWGFAQGKTEKATTPIAVSGRVLAYPYENKEEFKKHIGDAVCSGPEGTVSIMTDEEVQKYPLSIIGTISAVPEYEEWGGGSDRDPVKVNGRVWIRIK